MPKIEYIPGKSDHHAAMSQLDAVLDQMRSEARRANRAFSIDLDKGATGTTVTLKLGPPPTDKADMTNRIPPGPGGKGGTA